MSNVGTVSETGMGESVARIAMGRWSNMLGSFVRLEAEKKAMRSISMAHVDRTAELDLAQGKRERHGRKRDQHQDPERVHVSKERRLRLHLLSDPLNGLIMRLHQR